jgi:hypothetical protein
MAKLWINRANMYRQWGTYMVVESHIIVLSACNDATGNKCVKNHNLGCIWMVSCSEQLSYILLKIGSINNKNWETLLLKVLEEITMVLLKKS